MSVEEEIKEGMRRYVAEHGHKVKFREEVSWGGTPRVSTYGWGDYPADEHVRKSCKWIVPKGAVVTEETYSMFDGTFTNNKDEVGINASGCRCKCGRYKDVTLRVTSSLGSAIRGILGYDPTKRMEL